MKYLLFVLAGLLAVLVVGCGLTSGDSTITKGEELSGTITADDTEIDGWLSKSYKVTVQKGTEYFIRLAHDDGDTVGIWSPDAGEFLVKVNGDVSVHTAAYRFDESGEHELFVRTPSTEEPVNYQIKVWQPGF